MRQNMKMPLWTAAIEAKNELPSSIYGAVQIIIRQAVSRGVAEYEVCSRFDRLLEV